MTQQLQQIIDQAWEDRANINPANGAAELRDAVSHVIADERRDPSKRRTGVFSELM